MKIDFSSPAWGQISEWAKAEIERLRISNDTVGKPQTETDATRGEIRMLKRLLALPEAARRGIVVGPEAD